MSILPAPQADALRECLQRLLTQTATTEWRGLCVIRCASQINFKWPSSALTLGSDISAYRQYLGTSQSMLVLDMRHTLHADALAATIPTVQAKGLAIILLPAEPTPFSRRLVNQFTDSPLCRYVELSDSTETFGEAIDFSDLPVAAARGQVCGVSASADLQEEQQVALIQLQQHIARQRAAPALINAPRGRGKSTLLGVLAGELAAQGDPVLLCAPSRRQAQTLLAAAGCADMAAQASSPIQYIAADKLLAENSATLSAQLIVDEAASLPRHMLDELVKRYPNVIMATTSEGYETCGRGFLLQFQRQLENDYPSYLSLQLSRPIRFAASCPVESWLHRSLLLTPVPPPQVKHTHSQSPSASAQLSYSTLQAAELSEETLATSFSLLMDAHYQTSPNDLKLLLDDPSQTLVLQWQSSPQQPQRTLVGVVWLSCEGGLPTALAEEVMRGTRRPPGNLLAQSLTRHTQLVEPACALWQRVVRIAVRSDLQQKGLGSALLEYVMVSARQQNYAGIGTSFASATQINRFWCRHGFAPIRLGSRRDSVTARYSLLMLQPLAPAWAADIQRWANYFECELAACQALLALSDSFVASLQYRTTCWPPLDDQAKRTAVAVQQRQTLPYEQWAAHKIRAFAKGFLDLDSVRTTLLSRYPEEVANIPLLALAVQGGSLSPSDKVRYNLTGRKALTEKTRQICLRLPVKL